MPNHVKAVLKSICLCERSEAIPRFEIVALLLELAMTEKGT